jgi:hypothetical protein
LNMKLFNLRKIHWKITHWFCASFLNKSSNTIFKLSYLCVFYRFSYFNITNSRSRFLLRISQATQSSSFPTCVCSIDFHTSTLQTQGQGFY